MKILCDQMLGTLAKWLRIMGFDTFYANAEMSDEDLLNIAKGENRTIFTRDKELIISPGFGKCTFEIIASEMIMMTGKMYKNSISKNASIIIIMALIEAGRPTKNFLSFSM